MTSQDQRGASHHHQLSEHAAKVRGIFTHMAPKYSLFNHLASFGIHRLWLKHTVRIAERFPHNNVLDLAAGTGDLTYAMCRSMASSPEHIMSTDFCPEMLEIAKQRCAHESHGVTVEFEQVDAMHLPFSDESFDLVTVGYGVRNFDDRTQAFSEAMRVLKPGGGYVILDFATPPNRVWRALYYLYLRFVIPAVGFCLRQDLNQFYYFINSIKTFPPQDAIAQELVDAGFTDVSYKNCNGGITAIHAGRKAIS